MDMDELEYIIFQRPDHNMRRLLFIDCRGLTYDTFREQAPKPTVSKRRTETNSEVAGSSITMVRTENTNRSELRESLDILMGSEIPCMLEESKNSTQDHFPQYFYQQMNGLCFMTLLLGHILREMHPKENPALEELFRVNPNGTRYERLYKYKLTGTTSSFLFGELFLSLKHFKFQIGQWKAFMER